MKIPFKLLLIVFGILQLAACSSKAKDIQKAAWLIGTWESKTPDGSVYETWQKTSETEYGGKSYMVHGKDTMVLETIRLVQSDSALLYIPTVKDQNNNMPVTFAAKSVAENLFVFENPQHDFPQRITYTKESNDALVAEISGSLNGKSHKEIFAMKRLQ